MTLAATTRNRWVESEQIAAAINEIVPDDNPLKKPLNKHIVFGSFHKPIKRMGLMDRIIAKDKDAVFEFIASENWKQYFERHQLRVHEPGQDAEGKYIFNKKGEKMYDSDIMRLALWFVAMCGGDLDIAERAIRACRKSEGIIQ